MKRAVNKSKGKKKKPYKSVWSNAIWSFAEMIKYAPRAFVLYVLEVPVQLFRSYAEIYLPALVVVQVTENRTLLQAASSVGVLLLLMTLADITVQFTSHVSGGLQGFYRYKESCELSRKTMNSFYQNYERKEIRDLHSRAQYATEMWNGSQPLTDVPRHTMYLVRNVLSYVLFGTIISFASPWLVPILTIAPVVNWFAAKAYRDWEYTNRDKWTDVDRKLWYVQNMPSDFKAAKDIRIYGMTGWFQEIFKSLSKERFHWDKEMAKRNFRSRMADIFVILLRDGAAYALLISMILKGDITVDQFVLYFAAISSFAGFVGNIMNEWNKIQDASLQVCDFREYMDYEEQDGTGEESIEKHLMSAPEISFEHVSFRYDGAEEDTLKDIHFTIKSGQKIALVGLNGAGKTTLVKLLCGLYLPTEGDIKINGVSVRKFYRKDYYKLFSPVFQKVETAFFSLAETVAGSLGSGVDYKLAEKCMRLAGLGEKIDSLPEGIYTKLDKQVNENAIELSGGEVQKLMLARALYKDAPMLVLDEPTAALDPIAENHVYMQYRDMSKGKSALFISHRLASTQFCDRILYLKDGRITEDGTHSELLAYKGEYSELYEMQSCWYRDDTAEKHVQTACGKEGEL